MCGSSAATLCDAVLGVDVLVEDPLAIETIFSGEYMPWLVESCQGEG